VRRAASSPFSEEYGSARSDAQASLPRDDGAVLGDVDKMILDSARTAAGGSGRRALPAAERTAPRHHRRRHRDQRRGAATDEDARIPHPVRWPSSVGCRRSSSWTSAKRRSSSSSARSGGDRGRSGAQRSRSRFIQEVVRYDDRILSLDTTADRGHAIRRPSPRGRRLRALPHLGRGAVPAGRRRRRHARRRGAARGHHQPAASAQVLGATA
jgi:hypothetical protein